MNRKNINNNNNNNKYYSNNNDNNTRRIEKRINEMKTGRVGVIGEESRRKTVRASSKAN